jgi:tetratricopeptide (TPR) repeat protein
MIRLRAGSVKKLFLPLIAGLFLVLPISCSTVPYTDADEGDDLVDAGRYDEAIVEYTRSINLQPRNPEPYLGRAYAYQKKGQYDYALADYTRATEVDPKDPHTFLARGLFYDFLGKPQQAIEDYNRALMVNPSFADAFYYRGVAWEKLGNSQSAVADLKRAALMGDPDAQAKLKSMGITW